MAAAGIPEGRLKTFVEVLCMTGNAAEAARAAGYKGNPKVVSEQARKLLRRPDVQQMIDKTRTKTSEARVATREERQEWWSRVMRGESIPQMTKEGEVIMAPAPAAIQMKAAELLGKSEGDFIKRVEVKHDGQVTLFRAEIPDNGRSKPATESTASVEPSTPQR